MNRPAKSLLPHCAAALAALLLSGAAGCARRAPHWDLTNIRGVMPNLRFTLDSQANPHLTAADFRGKVVLLYFGYTHCPDVCPETMSRLSGILRSMGSAAQGIRIVFVSVDPKRDTPALLNTYVKAFCPEAIGATSSEAVIQALAKRYDVACQALPPDKSGNYVVMHGKAVYVFDRQGRIRLLIDDTDTAAAVRHDLRQLELAA
ncbi:MAG: SCO family protein [Opitutaceae bacterium]